MENSEIEICKARDASVDGFFIGKLIWEFDRIVALPGHSSN